MEVLIGNQQNIFCHVETILNNVFIEEQGIPEDEIFDSKTDGAMYIVIMEHALPVATARVRKEAGAWRIGLVAVEKTMRGLQYGRKIMETSIDYIKGAGGTEILLTAPSDQFHSASRAFWVSRMRRDNSLMRASSIRFTGAEILKAYFGFLR